MEQAEQGTRRRPTPGTPEPDPSLAQAPPRQCPPWPWSYTAFPAAPARGQDVPARCAEWWDCWRPEASWPRPPGAPPPPAAPGPEAPPRGPRARDLAEAALRSRTRAHTAWGWGGRQSPRRLGPAVPEEGRAVPAWGVKPPPVLFLLKEPLCHGSPHRSPEQRRPGTLTWLAGCHGVPPTGPLAPWRTTPSDVSHVTRRRAAADLAEPLPPSRLASPLPVGTTGDPPGPVSGHPRNAFLTGDVGKQWRAAGPGGRGCLTPGCNGASARQGHPGVQRSSSPFRSLPFCV